MRNDILLRLPSRVEIGREIVLTSQRSRRLRALYRLLSTIEAEAERDTDKAIEESTGKETK